MGIRQRRAAEELLDGLRDAYAVAEFFATATTVPAQHAIRVIDAFSRHMTRAHSVLQAMQAHGLTNAQIAALVAAELDPAPSNMAAAYTGARQAALAALDAYGAAPVTGEWTWNPQTRLHEQASVTFAHAAAFATARDALAVFA